MNLDPALLDFCTASQRDKLQAVIDFGGVMAAGRKLKIDHACVSRAIKAVKKKAALQGYAPEADMTHPVPSPFVTKGVSTYYDEDGKVRGQWVKTKLDEKLAVEAIQEWIESLTQEIKGKSPKIPVPKTILADLLAVYPMGDPHLGMYAWAAEAGEDFDLAIAESLIKQTIDRLVLSAPAAKTAILLDLGDFFHSNDQTNKTPQHGFQLDVDSRYPKVLMVGIRTLRYAVESLLGKHEIVIVRFEPGNHDPQAIWALALTMAAYFENNPRVKIDLSPSKFWFYRFGKVLIGSSHGDTAKHEVLPGVMAADRPEDWGATKHRYWYTGHIHTQTVKEFPGVICESFRTLAARDAYAAGHGYRAGRDMYCIIHHKEHGEIERHRCDIGML